MRVCALVFAATAFGCKKTPEAPRDLDQLSHDVYLHYDDPVALTADVIEMLPVVISLIDAEESEKGYKLTDLTEEEVAAVERPAGRELSLLIGAAVLGRSAFPPSDHGVSMVEASQIWNDPRTYNLYDREIIAGEASQFAGGDGRIDTENDIEKEGAFNVTVPYILMKDFQWVATPEGEAVVARSWVEERGCNDGGSNCLEASFSLEFYLPDRDAAGASMRLTSTWIDLVTAADSLLTEESSLDFLVDGIYDIFENTDAHLAGTLEY